MKASCRSDASTRVYINPLMVCTVDGRGWSRCDRGEVKERRHDIRFCMMSLCHLLAELETDFVHDLQVMLICHRDNIVNVSTDGT